MSITPTAPAAPAQRRRNLMPTRPRRQVGGELPAATKAPAALVSLAYIVADLTALPKVDRLFTSPISVRASFAAAIDTDVPGCKSSPISASYGR